MLTPKSWSLSSLWKALLPVTCTARAGIEPASEAVIEGVSLTCNLKKTYASCFRKSKAAFPLVAVSNRIPQTSLLKTIRQTCPRSHLQSKVFSYRFHSVSRCLHSNRFSTTPPRNSCWHYAWPTQVKVILNWYCWLITFMTLPVFTHALNTRENEGTAEHWWSKSATTTNGYVHDADHGCVAGASTASGTNTTTVKWLAPILTETEGWSCACAQLKRFG